MGGSPGDVGEVPVTQVKQRKGCRMSCDVGEAMQDLENEALPMTQHEGQNVLVHESIRGMR